MKELIRPLVAAPGADASFSVQDLPCVQRTPQVKGTTDVEKNHYHLRRDGFDP
uniref:hypothetical protein n=1 Tax=Sphingomonas bacterium TaxID=1895847 RepID=UPI002616DF82|nr:hypothetical protein [Sphingomonas bacterium]